MPKKSTHHHDHHAHLEMRHSSTPNTKPLKSAKQAMGTMKKVVDMIESNQYCPDVIQQVDSVIGLLKTAKKQMLAGHLDTCVADQMKTNKKKAVEELLKIYNLSN